MFRIIHSETKSCMLHKLKTVHDVTWLCHFDMTCSMFCTATYVLWDDLYNILQCFPTPPNPKMLQLI